jgi:hypothetical protein
MARSGSENRQRPVTLKARFTREEAALVTEQAARAGVSVAAVIRFAVLDQKPLRASRKPLVEQEVAARLLAQLGLIASSLREAELTGLNVMAIEAAQRDLGEMRNLLFEALELEP